MCLPSISEKLTVGTKYKLTPRCNSPVSGMLGGNLYLAISSQQSDTESKYLPLVCLHGCLEFMSSKEKETPASLSYSLLLARFYLCTSRFQATKGYCIKGVVICLIKVLHRDAK